MSEWKEYKLGELTSVITKGTTPSTLGGGFVERGVNFIKSEAVSYNAKIDKSTFVFIDEETQHKLKRSQLKKDDILFSMAGIYLGKNGLVTEDMLPANTNQALAIIRLDQNKALPKFIHYYLRQKSVIEFVNNMSGQSAQPNINFEEIKAIDILLPPLPEQTAIASILSSLDDKIDLLQRQNKTLEQLAETLFRQWFVEEAEESWETRPLGKVFDIGIGRTPPRKEQHWFTLNPIDVKWVSIKDMGTSGIYIDTVSEYLTPKAVKTFSVPIIPENTVMLSFKMTIGRLAITTEKMVSNEAIAHFKQKENSFLFPEFLYLFLKTYSWEQLGSTSSIVEAINSQMIKEIEMIIPNEQKLNDFKALIKPYFQKIKSNQTQIRTLTQLRDTLLPKLMNGEVRVKFN